MDVLEMVVALAVQRHSLDEAMGNTLPSLMYVKWQAVRRDRGAMWSAGVQTEQVMAYTNPSDGAWR